MENTTNLNFGKCFFGAAFLKRCFFIFLIINFVGVTYAANISSTATGGNWSSGSTWAGGTIPGSNDVVTIVAGATVTVTGAATCNTLNVNGSLVMSNTGFTFSVASGNGNQGIINLNTGGSFLIGSANTVEFTSTQGGQIANNGGSIVSTGINGVDGGTILADACCGGGFSINGNTATTVYNLKFVQNCSFNTTSAPNNIHINGTFTIPNNNWNWSSGSAPIYGAGSTLYLNRNDQDITPPYAYWAAIAPGAGTIGTTAGYPNNVTVVTKSTSKYNGAGVDLTGSLSINGTLSIGDGTTPTIADMTQVTAFSCGGINIDNGSVLSGTTFTVNGGWSQKGATQGVYKDVGGGTITFSGLGTSVSPNIISATSATGLGFNKVVVGSASQKTYLKLQIPVSIATNINLVNGIILTDAVNLLTLVNVSPTTAITAAAGSFVDGPLQWNIGASPSTAPKSYTFPVGDGSSYLPLIITPNSTNGNSVTVQAVATGSGGTPDITTVTTLSNTEYWAMSATQAFTSGATISVVRSSGVGSFNMMAMSRSSAAGVYSSIGGTISGDSILNAGTIGASSPWYFAMANGPLSLKTVSVNNPTCTGTTGTVTLGGAGGTPPYYYSALSVGPFISTSNTFGPLAAGTYVFYAQDQTHSKTVTDTVVLKPLTLLPDTSTCAGIPLTLTTSGGYTYNWTSVPAGAFSGSTTVASPTANPSVNTTYYVTALILNTTTNLITNGDFEAGATGFQSDYINVSSSNNLPYNSYTDITDVSGVGNSGIYDITTNNHNMCNFFANFTDHTSGTGKMMVIDASTISNNTKRVWYETVNVVPNTDYVFQYYYSNATTNTTEAKAKVAFQVNGTTIAPQPTGFSTNPYDGSINPSAGWYYVAYKWNSGVNTSATFSLYDLIDIANGNDFCLDDISLYATCTATDSVHVKVATQAPAPTVTTPVNYCLNATPHQLTATGGAGATIYWYSARSGGIATTTAPTPTTTTAGTTTYYLSQIIPGGCSESPRDSIQVNILNSQHPIIKDTTICSGAPVTLNATPSGNTTDVINWYSDMALTHLVNTGKTYPNVSINTQTKYYLTEYNGSCTSGDTVLTVSVTQSPTISGTTTLCKGSTTTLSGTATAASPTAWSSLSTSIASVDNNGVVTGASAGTAKIVYANNGGCTDTTTVTVNALPTVSNNNAVCASGGTNTLTGSATAAGNNAWQSLSTSIATITNGGIVTGVAAGTDKIVYTNTNGCTDTVSVIVNALPAISGSLGVNKGSTTTLTGTATAATSNAWQSLTTSIATIDNNGVATGVADGTTKIVYTNSSGCTDTVTLTVTTNPIISGTLNACVKSTTQLFGSNVPATSGAWTSSKPLIATIDNTGLVTGISAGTSVITYTDNTGKDTIATVTINALPTASGASKVCTGSTTAFAGTGTAATSAAWQSLSSSIASIDNNGTVTGISSGISKIVYTDNNGCTDTTSITVNGLPVISPANPSSICAGTTTTLSGTATAASPTAWASLTPSITIVNNNGVVTGVSGGSGNIVYTNNNGCKDTVTVTVNALPTVPTANNGSRCGTGKVDLSVTPSGSATDTIKWYSDVALTNLLVKGNSYTTPTISTTTSYYVSETNISGCVTSASTTVTATVSSGPTPPTGVNAARCGTGSLTLTASINGNNTDVITWYSDAGLTNQITTPTPGTSYTTASLTSTTNYYITEVNTTNCASTPVTVTATINPIPVAPAGKDASRCGAGEVTLNASYSGVSTDVLTWYSDAGLTTQVGTGTSFTTPVISTTTSYYVTETNLCTSTATIVTATVNDVPSAPAGEDSSRCGTGVVVLQAIPSTDATDILNWYSDVNLTTQVAAGETFTTPVISTTTLYYVTEKTLLGCSSTSATTVTAAVLPQPNAHLALFNPICAEAPEFLLSGGTPVSGTNGTGSYSGEGVIGDSAFSPQQAGQGTFPIVYTFTSTNGCYDTAIQNIKVYPTPSVNYGSTQSVLQGDSIKLNPVVQNADLQYSWSPAVYLNNDTAVAPICKPTDSITYTITVTSPGGCSASTTLLVQVLRDFTVPNTFTPNNDGINDKWGISQLPNYPISWVQVFDRYGQMVYESHGYGEAWDGTYKGSQLPSGTYYYIIEMNGMRSPKTGYVTILR